MVGSLYVRNFLLSMIIILWIWRTCKCCDASNEDLNMHPKLIQHNDLFFVRV
jgi:hypothetical protein